RDEVGAGDVGRGVRSKEDDGAYDLIHVGHPPERHSGRGRIDTLTALVVPHTGKGECVHADPAARPVRREIAREVVQRRFRDRVGDGLEERLAVAWWEVVEVL